MRIVYSILHYMATQETIECVQSILESTKNSAHETKIIVVDNGSPNNSYQDLKKTFDNNAQVIIMYIDQNLGFARGNNVGFQYAKEKLNADFIILLNNDTLIYQADFNEVIVQKYLQYHYAVLGPDIITLDGCHQNPGKEVKWTNKKLMMFRIRKFVQFFLASFSVFDNFLTVNESAFSREKIAVDVLNTKLHGACLIFSKEYIFKFDGLYDKTFLYMEEDILRLRAEHYGYLMMYTPDIAIQHKEDIATNMMAIKSIDKKKLIYKNLLDSSKVYANLKKQYEKG